MIDEQIVAATYAEPQRDEYAEPQCGEAQLVEVGPHEKLPH